MSRSHKYTLCRDKWNFFFWISRNMALKLEYWCIFVGFTVRRGALSWRTLYSLFPIQFLDSKAIYLPRSRMASWNCVINCGECETFCCNLYYFNNFDDEKTAVYVVFIYGWYFMTGGQHLFQSVWRLCTLLNMSKATKRKHVTREVEQEFRLIAYLRHMS